MSNPVRILRPWQAALYNEVMGGCAAPRRITWVFDEHSSGKSVLVQQMHGRAGGQWTPNDVANAHCFFAPAPHQMFVADVHGATDTIAADAVCLSFFTDLHILVLSRRMPPIGLVDANWRILSVNPSGDDGECALHNVTHTVQSVRVVNDMHAVLARLTAAAQR